MTTTAIFGAAGAIGHALGAELDRRGEPYRVVGRNLERLRSEFPQAEAVQADLEEPEGARRAAAGVETIFFTLGMPYPEFAKYPALMRNVVAAAHEVGAQRLILVSSVYSYGTPQTPTVNETHPRDPIAFKGKMRKEQEEIVLQAHRDGKLKGLVVHFPDFYGAHAERGLAHIVFQAALAGKAADWVGSPEKPHEFIYVPDTGPILLDLAAHDAAYGERWNCGGTGTITGREFMERVYAAAGTPLKFHAANKFLLRTLGLFNPMIREVVEMYYLSETPVIIDDSKLRGLLGTLKRTSYQDGIAETIRDLRRV